MGSSRQQDRSLNAGISLPQWMKGKIDNRFDFDESAFSPPSHDEGFFCIRYPKSQNSTNTTQDFRSVKKVFNDNTITTSTNQVTSSQQTHSKFKEVKEIDFSQHPLPCQPFVPTAINKVNTTLAGTIKPAKSQGTDDGFHGEPALCGKSIVHVANQMMSNKFNKPHTSVASVEQELIPRKGSKSLPATPLASPITSPDSSPKSRRKINSNRYFTGAFIPDRDKYQGSWILASILGQSREIVTSKIEEEQDSGIDIAPPKILKRKKSISSQNLTYIGKDEKTSGKSSSQTNILQAKPSELREMNFWSPTSM
ncbi:transcription factor GAGA isoform X1 [Vespula maculifrons]|uniref:Uncharacterized protein n=2 Tax=Vespula TaxID=7451 RepID=A0A834K228_VESPE|nr:uncharacterized protein LOC122635891 isoform X1 [Vespula pensylvanica]XP_050866394.1 uncharacterized protein LOC127071317 isoform X1 [Vespula vulgaris]KAF7397139.1 hypothetical protein H0235_016676 [Vespula pensylvanica]